jgi:asparagine synthetase B (glutamine-hydrolysing)
MSRWFDPSFVNRPKQGFAMPTTHWFEKQSAMRRLIDDMVIDPRAPINRFFDPAGVQALVSSHGPQNNQAGRIWLLMMLGVWLDGHRDINFTDASGQTPAISRSTAPVLSNAA